LSFTVKSEFGNFLVSNISLILFTLICLLYSIFFSTNIDLSGARLATNGLAAIAGADLKVQNFI